jgi:hypothetical protein
MSILKRIGLSAKVKDEATSGPETKPVRMSLEERMALRREMAFQVVRDVLGEWGLPETSYRFKVVPMDPRGHTYAAMIDLPIQFTSEINVGHKELKRLGVVIDGAARTRFKVRVLGVYWRISDSLTVDLSDQAGTRQKLPGLRTVAGQEESVEHARIAAIEQSLAYGTTPQVNGRLYDTDHAPLGDRLPREGED